MNGEACDWMYHEHGIFAYTPEVGSRSDGFWPETARIVPLSQENVHPNVVAALMAGPHLSLGMPFPSWAVVLPSSEFTVEVTVFNAGLSTAGELTVSTQGAASLSHLGTEVLQTTDRLTLTVDQPPQPTPF